MTAITLNLLAEEQQAQVERARDPIKLFIVIGLTVLTVAVAWGGVLSAILSQRHVELLGLEGRWKQMNDTDQGEGDYQKDNDFAAEIISVNHSRILLAPQLALVKDLIPPSVQLSHISFAQATETTGGDSGGDGAEGKHHARPKESRHLVLQLEGMASSVQPELEVDRFLTSLRNDARFGALVEDIQLRSIARATSDTDKAGSAGVPAVNFTIECWYKEQVKK